jgi:hypothetical protein
MHQPGESSDDDKTGEAADDDEQQLAAAEASGPPPVPPVVERLQQTVAAASAVPERVVPAAITHEQLHSAVRSRAARIESEKNAAHQAEAEEELLYVVRLLAPDDF